jgi:diaminohydroxyphosphoribosylaminopyrimidine deaminase/5-amino-6-(5-phosphoribosylamino)uracil reductase
MSYLNIAHKLAQKKIGTTFPNPVVGCILVKNDIIIAKGVTSFQGRPHAEEIALKKAGDNAKGSTMYVTLEPCFHNSRNGSCAEQILKSGIKSLYISKYDPDLRTNKKSIKKLKKNKIKVYLNLQNDKIDELNYFYFHSLKNKRPFTKVKMAISKDEKIAKADYKSKWISNSLSRKFSHKLRFSSQAILTSSKTIIKDNPRFTIRKEGKIIKHIPIIIIDSSLKIPLKSNLLKDLEKKRIIIFTTTQGKKLNNLKQLGCEIIILKKQANNQMNLKTIFRKIYDLKIKDIFVEAGGILFTNLLKSNLVDELHIFKSQKIIGDDGIPVILNKKIGDLNTKEIARKKFINDIYQRLRII